MAIGKWCYLLLSIFQDIAPDLRLISIFNLSSNITYDAKYMPNFIVIDQNKRGTPP